MAEQKNPLREWRGEQSYGQAAWLLGCDYATYVVLERAPWALKTTTDNILEMQRVTQIPLEVLVDYLTETTKEMA